ncbi:prolyl hydroxylase family protein [Sphingomonas tabacisoli]|uniref:Prolyl hydroxylase family protein n=1 Tax=Sphingomonas tabacisoli TaxID=2249466 RepID=A0ABW4HYM9_9SPHN
MSPEEIALQTSPTRARIGAETGVRLAAAGVPSVKSPNLTLWYIEKFLLEPDCAYLIEQIDRNRYRSTTLSDTPDDNFRTSESGNLNRWDERIRAIDLRICGLMGMDERQGETLQGQRYAPGQYFLNHHDFFHTDQAYWPDQEKAGGQRTWTAMIYLNQPEAGGDTAFLSAGLRVPPRAGMLLMWNNMDANGAPNIYASHEGSKVEAGVKYIVTKWFREGFWC